MKRKHNAVIDFTCKLLKFRFGDELFIVNNACLAYILAHEPDEVEALKETLPAWAVIVGITGGHILPREKVEAQENDIRDIAQQFGLKMVPAIQGCRGGELLELILKPSPEPHWKLRYKGASQEVFFLTTLDRTPGWVMPTGDTFRIGSLGSGCGWFCGEGPGPSMKGVARGFLGAKGAMGVFTKCAIKLFAWPGPETLPVEGVIPAYKVSLPDNFKAYTVAFPSWKAWADAAYMIWDTGIGYLAHRQFNMFGRDLKYAMVNILTDPTKTLGDLEEILEDPEVQRITQDSKREFQIILAGMTPRDMAWQEKAFDEILARTGGWKVEAMNEPAIHDWALLYLIRLGHKNLNLVFGGSYDGCFGLLGAADYGASHAEEAAEFKKVWEKRGAMVEAGGDCMMGPIGGQGGGGTVLWENFTCFDSYDRQSTEGTLEFFDACTRLGLERGWGVGMEKWNAVARGPDGRTTPKEERDRIHLSAPQPSVFRYQHKIREAFNPNDLGDAYYETLEDS